MKKFGFVFVFVLSLFAQSAMADLLGLASGRSANMDNMADMSVEGGINIGGDGQLFGSRFNFKASPDLMVFGDVGLLTIDNFGSDADGMVFGGGAFYQLRSVTLLENTDFAVKGAYHLGTLDFGGVDLDYTEISIEALISGDQLGDTDFGWYANAGMHIIETDLGSASTVFVPGFGNVASGVGGSNSENELLFGGGITGPLSFGEFFAGVDFLDGALIVAGVRYNL